MAGAQKRGLASPDDTRKFPNGQVDVVTIGDVVFAKATIQPGWRWSEHVKPIAGTDSCQIRHTGFVTSGRLHVVTDDGAELDMSAGDVYVIPPGHDAWVVGDEPFVAHEFSPGVAKYPTE